MAILRLLCFSAPSGVSVSVKQNQLFACFAFLSKSVTSGMFFFSLELSLVLLIGCNWLLPNAGNAAGGGTALFYFKTFSLKSLELVTFVASVMGDCRVVSDPPALGSDWIILHQSASVLN